jgi:NhaP-type Na+/H+ or K+/H+ antiporter
MISIADGIGLLIGIVVIATIADRLRIAYPILLVIAGVAVALIPIHHRIEFEPDLILLVFLPPLIYDATLDTSAREIRSQLRPILCSPSVWCW